MKNNPGWSLIILALAGCAADGSGLATAPTSPANQIALRSAVESASLKPASARTTARGSLTGDGEHITTGTAEIFWYRGGWYVALGPDFSVSSAPDPKVALGNTARGGFQEGAILADLDIRAGEQVYPLPPGLDIADYDQVVIWCAKFGVPLGHADLTLL